MNPSLWSNDLGPLKDALHSPVEGLPAEADTVILGAGYTGLNAARELSRAGQRVVVFEKGSIGDGASGLNFGSAALGVAASFHDLCARYGEAFTRSTAELSRMALEGFCQLVGREAIDCDLQKTGHLTVAQNPAQLKKLKSTREAWERFAGHDMVLLSEDEVKRHLDVPGITGGLLNPDSYSINPAKYLAGLTKAAANAGAMIIEQAPISQVRRIGPGLFESRCGGGVIRSKHVVVCTGGILLPGFKPSYRGIVPINSYLIATAPLAGFQLELISRKVFSTSHAIPCYFRVTPSNRLLFGSRKNLAAKPSQARDTAELTEKMNALLPFMSCAQVTHSWSGSLGFTFDRLPHIGISDGIYYSLGCCGKGIPWSAYCGIAVANLVRGGKPEQAMAMPMLQPLLYGGHPWFLRPLSWYLQAKDALTGLTARS